jgi:thiol-disulfide isomerase/thioredoxin
MPEPRRNDWWSNELRKRLLALSGVVVIVGVAVAVLAAAGVLGNQGGGEGIGQVALLDTAPAGSAQDLDVGPQKGKLAPDFEISAFDGSRHRLSDFRGRVVYVNFWATWCTPCLFELPDIQELLNRHKDELVVIAVNRGEPLDRARSFMGNLARKDGGNGVDLAVQGMDPDDTLYDAYRALGMPASIFVDANGVVTRVVNGLIVLEQMETAYAEAASPPAPN